MKLLSVQKIPDGLTVDGDLHNVVVKTKAEMNSETFGENGENVNKERRLRFHVTQCQDESAGNDIEKQYSEENLTSSTISSSRRFSVRSLTRKFSSQASIVEDRDYWPEENDVKSVAKRGLLFGKRHKRRLVFKSGESNLSYINIRKRNRMFFLDFFTTMIDLKWRFIFLIYGFAFIGGWVMFAFFWWIICITHNDHIHKDNDEWNKCVDNVYDFQTALLFSIETQHTIGYGDRGMTPYCPAAVVCLMAQSCFGVVVNALMAGLVFGKLSRPIKRSQTIIFSKRAVICQRDGQRYLLFRVADTRKSRLIATTIRAVLIKKKITTEGEILPFYQHPISVIAENGDSSVLLMWPITIMHKIDSSSPFYDLNAEQLLRERFELIVFLEGTVEPTGMCTQVRTSYLPSEILWGHQLASLITYKTDNFKYLIDYTLFHNTIPTEMHETSAHEYVEQKSLATLPENNNNTEGKEDNLIEESEFLKKMPNAIQMELLPCKDSYKHKNSDCSICNENVTSECAI